MAQLLSIRGVYYKTIAVMLSFYLSTGEAEESEATVLLWILLCTLGIACRVGI